MGKGDPHQMDISVCHTENSVEDVTIRFTNGDTGHRPAAAPADQEVSESEASRKVEWDEPQIDPNSENTPSHPNVKRPVEDDAVKVDDDVVKVEEKEDLDCPNPQDGI